MTDPYESRGERAGIRERQDPVLYVKKDGSVPEADAKRLDQYAKDGFLFFPDLFSSEEIRNWQQEAVRIKQDGQVVSSEYCITEPSSGDLRSIFYVHKTNEIFKKLSHHPKIIALVKKILGSPVYVHQSRINYKPAFEGKEFYWHSDFETWHMEDGMPRMRAVSCSIYLTDNNAYNGPTMVIPGSHRHYVACPGETPENHYKKSLKKQEYGVPDHASLKSLVDQGGITAPTGPAGSVLFLECNIMHGSSGNLTPWPRSNIFLVYNSVDNKLVDPFCGLKPRPEYIASRKIEPLIG